VLVLADEEDARDVGMVELGDRPHLTLKPHSVGLSGQGRAQDLERNDAIERDLAGLVDDPHPARPEPPPDPEIAQCDARRRVVLVHRPTRL
jgi:hypothetical protein